MDRTRTVQDVQAGMARAEAAAQGIARSARQLPQWGLQGGAYAINTAMGQVWSGLLPQASQLQVDLEEGIGGLMPALEDVFPAMPADSLPWTGPEWDMWYHELLVSVSRWSEARIRHLFLGAMQFGGPIPTAVDNLMVPLGPHLADITSHVGSLTDDITLVRSSVANTLDQCWPSAKSRIAAHEKRAAEMASIESSLTRLHALDSTQTNLEATLATARELDNKPEVDRCNREFREVEQQVSSTMRTIYHDFEGLTSGTPRSRDITMSLPELLKPDPDPIVVIDAIVKHVTTYVGDFPTIFPDIRLMWADFDPQTGLFWNPDPIDVPEHKRTRYIAEAKLLHTRLSGALGQKVYDEIVDTGIPHGRDNLSIVTIDHDSTDGILLFRATRDYFFKSSERYIVAIEDEVNAIGTLFAAGFPADILGTVYEPILKKAEKYGIRVKWSLAGRGILKILGRRLPNFTHLIELDRTMVHGGDYSDDAIPLLRKLATKIKVLCKNDQFRPEMWGVTLASDHATTISVNSSITNELNALTPRSPPASSNPNVIQPTHAYDIQKGFSFPCSRPGCTTGRLAPHADAYCAPCHANRTTYPPPRYDHPGGSSGKGKGKGTKGKGKGGKGKGKSKGKGKGKGAKGERRGVKRAFNAEVKYEGHEGYDEGGGYEHEGYEYYDAYEGSWEGYEGYEQDWSDSGSLWDDSYPSGDASGGSGVEEVHTHSAVIPPTKPSVKFEEGAPPVVHTYHATPTQSTPSHDSSYSYEDYHWGGWYGGK